MKKAWMMLLVTAIAAVGGLVLGLAYLAIWQPTLIGKLIQYAAAIALAYFGVALLCSCFSFLPQLWKRD